MEHEVISRKEAKKLGLEQYFTGKPCKHGGVGKRQTSTGMCLCDTCREIYREKSRRYHEENRDLVLEKQRSYRENNPEAVAESNRLAREKYRDKRAAYSRGYYAANREAVRETLRLYREKNREQAKEYHRQYREENPDYIKELKRRYAEENPEKVLANCAKRRAAKRQAIPVWFSELDCFLVEEAYDLAAQRLKETGIEWHVDHMIPLRARKASGLHCAANIQVIPAVMNMTKNNKMLLTEPLAWLR